MSFLISDFANRVTETTSGEVGQPLSMQITEVKSILHKTHIKTHGSESRGQVKQLRTPQPQMTRPLHVRILQEQTL